MTARKLVYSILAAFVAGTLALVYLQYNSSKNINRLINDNVQLLGEVTVSNQLKGLEKEVLAVENDVKGAVTTQDSSYLKELAVQWGNITLNLEELQKISDSDSSIRYIDDLDTLVKERIVFTRLIVDSLRLHGKIAAEKLIASQRGRILTDSITRTIEKIDSTRKIILSRATASIDQSGRNALQMGGILIIIVLITAAGLFWYIITTIQRQDRLIAALNESERKVRESVRLKENFLANMSHEIRTPMNAILGFTNLLQREQLDGKSKEYVQTIQKSGENLLTIINDILDLSKIEAGMMRLEKAPFSMRGLLHSIAVMFQSKANEKNIQLTATVDDDVPDTLEGDATRLTQILVNLIGNALKFTPQGLIRVRVRNAGWDAGHVKTGITVTDTGIGIAPGKLQEIFERFRQAEDSVTRNYGGTGLGLAIVKELVMLQHGSLDVSSEPGKGTSFSLIIPYEIAKDTAALPGESTSGMAPGTIGFSGTRVLVAEDNELNQSLIRHLFQEWALPYDIVPNGKAALTQLERQQYDLVLMDIQMPEMDGYTAAQEIRKRGSTVPIIAMTAHALAGEREKCLSFGMNEYISKPIRAGQLHQLIATFVQLGEKPKLIITDTAQNIAVNDYRVIRLDYMRSISAGDHDYEKTVTGQFIEAVPEELAALRAAWEQQDEVSLKQIAHNMKTTVSIMGIDEQLKPWLDTLEYEQLSQPVFEETFAKLTLICEAALREATLFYNKS